MVVRELLACMQPNRHEPQQHFGTPTVECPLGGDMRKYTSAEERAVKNQKLTVHHFGYEESILTSIFNNTAQHNTINNSIDNSVVGMSLMVHIAVEARRRWAASVYTQLYLFP